MNTRKDRPCVLIEVVVLVNLAMTAVHLHSLNGDHDVDDGDAHGGDDASGGMVMAIGAC